MCGIFLLEFAPDAVIFEYFSGNFLFSQVVWGLELHSSFVMKMEDRVFQVDPKQKLEIPSLELQY